MGVKDAWNLFHNMEERRSWSCDEPQLPVSGRGGVKLPWLRRPRPAVLILAATHCL